MANTKIPKGYKGTYMKSSGDEPVLVMVSRTTNLNERSEKMAENKFEKWSTEQKKQFGKQFSAKERASYRKGQENAYRHSANMAGHQAKFLAENRSENKPAKK